MYKNKDGIWCYGMSAQYLINELSKIGNPEDVFVVIEIGNRKSNDPSIIINSKGEVSIYS